MLLLLCLASAALSAVLVRAMIRLAVLDVPGHRSDHARPTPKGGGVGVVVAFLVFVPVAAWAHLGAGRVGLWLVLCAVALLALVSWLDDLRQFPPLVKLAAQVGAAALVLAALSPLPYGVVGLLGALCWLLFATNALNFIDGLNGLASGSMALACLFVGLGSSGSMQASAACVLAAALLGFLPFNMPRARIFLGDVGSQGAGLAVAAFGLMRWQQPTPGSVLVMPLLLAGILYDVAFTLCRRLLAGERLFEAHRGHLYQVARRSGIAVPAVAVLHWAFVLWGGILSVALTDEALSPQTAIMLAATPQIAWSILVWRRARSRDLGRW